MDLAAFAAFDQVRDLSTKPVRAVCYSPYNSLFFDTRGLVRACCLNQRYVLGNVAKERLPDIWHGAKVRQLRNAMARYDLRLGCEACGWQIADGNFSAEGHSGCGVHALKYDEFPVAPDSLWPTNMEFNLANTCNLECVMCNGDFSSSIRSRREHLEPLPRPYDDVFFEDLREFIPHLRSAQFLGGEPFLIVEHFRVWDMLIESGTIGAVGVTTNGTIYNHKVERILESLPVGITISADGVTRETFEKIRVNASFAEFLANFRKFHAYGERVRRPVSFNFTLSRLNCHEFGAFLRFADENGCLVNVCTLTEPSYLSLYKMPKDQLAELVAGLERQEAHLHLALPATRALWTNTLRHLQNRVANADASISRIESADLVQIESASPSRRWAGFALADKRNALEQKEKEEAAAALLAHWSGGEVDVLVTDRKDVVTRARYFDHGFLGVDADVHGLGLDQLLGLCTEHFGSELIVNDLDNALDRTDRLVTFQRDGGKQIELRVIEMPRFEDGGAVAGMTVLIGRRRPT